MSAQFASEVTAVVHNGPTYFYYPETEYPSNDLQEVQYDFALNDFESAGSSQLDSISQSSQQYPPSDLASCSSIEYSDYESSESDCVPEASLDNINSYTIDQVHEILMGWRLTAEQRNINGYPDIGESRGRLVEVVPPTVYTNGKKMWIDESDKERQCCRCSAFFEVDSNGDFPTEEGTCVYKTKRELRVANTHITAQKFATELLEFVTAPAPSGKNDGRSKMVYALDAEMVATTAGPALARLSMVDMSGALVLDVMVKPPHKIVDPLTEFSGLTVEMVESAEHTIESAQQMLFELINSETILVGHSLESDLKALRLVHWNTVDTAILYANEYGNKIALKDLSKEYLGRKIQSDNEDREGHCSHEDALASLDLVKFRINYGT